MQVRQDIPIFGYVYLNGEEIQGTLKSISVGGAIIYEKSGAEKAQSKKKIVSGYEDKTVSITYQIISKSDDEASDHESLMEQVEAIENMFMKTEEKLPKVYFIDHPLLKARHIERVLFKSFNSDVSTGVKQCNATLEFIEFVPAKYEVIDKETAASLNASENQKQKNQRDFVEEGRQKAIKTITGK
ncbi:MAG: hypothetical protein JXB50_02250 [Spirochaetes bacterium]|nr:hypothetical protein [Spirochaetota bacterium]